MQYRLFSRAKARLAVGAALAIAGAAGVAWACADEGCSPNWNLSAPGYDCAGSAAITPGNDTRINMLWLMRSLQPVSSKNAAYPKPDYDNRQFGHTFLNWAGLRAVLWPAPHDSAGSSAPACTPPSDFSAALAADPGLGAADRASLLQIRGKVGCDGKVDWAAASVGSAAGREYQAYLKAADAFYTGAYAEARAGFAPLAHARSKWLAETAAYMPIRIGLRAAVAGASGKYGDFDAAKVDKSAVAEARAAIGAYLRTYPHGRYADSARGLMRRVLWLEGNSAELARIYESLLTTTPADSEASATLAEEIDIRVLGADAGGGDHAQPATDFAHTGGTPMLLAISDLANMRRVDADKPLPLSAADLAAQQGQFAGHPDLYSFLAATRSFYAGEDPKGVMAMIPDASHAPSFTPLGFSRQVLRGQALARAHDPNEAGFWRDLMTGASPLYQRPLVELGLALRWQRDGRVDQVFAPASPVQDATTRVILAQTLASPAILRAEARDTTRPAHERDIARFSLLYKDLSRGAYASFAGDVALVPAGADAEGGLWSITTQDKVPVGLFARGKWAESFACPALTQTAAVLARSPGDQRARLCLGEFWRLNGFDQFSLYAPANPDGTDPKTPIAADTLGVGRDLFPGRPAYRDAIYGAIIADRTAPADIRAYALYRMIHCYAPAGYNGCAGPGSGTGDRDVPKAQRKAWYDELRAKYPTSPWAKGLYW